MGCFKHFRKWTVLIFNLIFLIVGVALIVTGALLTNKMDDLVKVMPSSYHYVTGTPITLIVLGSIIVLVSIFGTLGVFKYNVFLLNLYTITLIVIFLLHIILSIASFWAVSNQTDLAVNINSTVADVFQSYEKNKETVDFVQTKLECCGTYGSKSWVNSIPSSCDKSHYKDGCQNALYDFVLKIIRIVGTVILVLAPIQVIGATLSLSLVNYIRNYKRRYGSYS